MVASVLSDALRVAIIADDLTGALDVAGPFASRGAPTWVVVDHARCSPGLFPGAQVVSINTASRHASAAEASGVVGDVTRALQALRPAVWLKKIDSTLRGNVVAETLAMLEASARTNAIVAPAFPGQGRTVRGGVVHVNGIPLPQTPFARDALSKPPLEPLDAVFRAAAPHARVAKVGPEGPFDLASANEAPRIFVVDAETDEDLRGTVRAIESRLDDCLLVGAAGIAKAIAESCVPATGRPSTPGIRSPILFVVGSRAEQSAAQVEALRTHGMAAVMAAPNGVLGPDSLRLADSVVVLRATPGADGREGIAEEVARRLADSSALIIEQNGLGALVATGGDTAIAILQALRQPALQVMGDLLPGIPYCRLEVAGRPLWLITKAGGFGTPQTFVQIVELLRKGTNGE